MTYIEDSLQKAVYALSGNSIHPQIVDFVHDMHEGMDYHNLTHCNMCKIYLEHYYPDLDEKPHSYLVLAIYFHDIYQDLLNPVTAIHESADLMEESFVDVLDSCDINVIQNIILSTGAKAPMTDLEKIMHDLDYEILGHEIWERYCDYAKGIEKEAAKQGINQKRFIKGRLNFLQMLACIPQIYLTKEIGQQHEWFARRNIIRENAKRQAGVF